MIVIPQICTYLFLVFGLYHSKQFCYADFLNSAPKLDEGKGAKFSMCSDNALTLCACILEGCCYRKCEMYVRILSDCFIFLPNLVMVRQKLREVKAS